MVLCKQFLFTRFRYLRPDYHGAASNHSLTSRATSLTEICGSLCFSIGFDIIKNHTQLKNNGGYRGIPPSWLFMLLQIYCKKVTDETKIRWHTLLLCNLNQKLVYRPLNKSKQGIAVSNGKQLKSTGLAMA